MRKILLSIVIAVMAVPLVACGTKSNEQHNKVVEKQEVTNATKNESNKDNSEADASNKVENAKLEEPSDGEVTNNEGEGSRQEEVNNQQQTPAQGEVSNQINIGRYMGTNQEGAAKITISYLENSDGYEAMIKSFEEKAKAEGKTLIAPSTPIGDRVFVIRTNDTITNLTLNNLGSKYMDDYQCDLDKYLRECGIEDQGNLAYELSRNQILVFTAHESEGIPCNYFCWTEPNGTTIYNSVVYDGKGGFYAEEN